jgi:TPR repeat protein
MASKVEDVWLFGFAALGVLLGGSQAQAGTTCPDGMWASGASCCELGSEYVESKNQCLPVRPERRCVEGHLDECVTAGKQLEQRGAIGAGYASELYRYACDQGHAPACRGLGSLYERGVGVERDEGRARGLHVQACEGGDAPACTVLAEKMIGDGTRTNDAISLFAQACHRGDPYACGEYGVLLARRPEQSKLSELYFERACGGGVASACRTLISRAREAALVDKERVRALLERACGAADAQSCVELGDGLRLGWFALQSTAQAAIRYRTACEGGLVSGCLHLAELTAQGDGVALDLARASELYTRACGAGSELACDRATELRVQAKPSTPASAQRAH